MGWCSGTETFDAAMDMIFNEEKSLKEKVRELIKTWQGMDWDCEGESAYWDHPLFREIWQEMYPGEEF